MKEEEYAKIEGADEFMERLKNSILGEEWLKDIEQKSFVLLMKRGYRIDSISDGFQVGISRIGEEGAEEHYAFGESIEEAIDEAIYKGEHFTKKTD